MVSWVYDASSCMAVITHQKGVSAGAQLFNNYGAKSNEELILSYGFVELDGPDDVLVIALRKEVDGPSTLYYWYKSSDPPAALLDTLLQLVGTPPGSGNGAVATYLREVAALEALERLVRTRRKTFRRTQHGVDDALSAPDLRQEVLDVVREYRRGTLVYCLH